MLRFTLNVAKRCFVVKINPNQGVCMAYKSVIAGLLGASMLSTTAFAATHDLGDLTPVNTGSATDVGVTTIDLIGLFTSSTTFDFSGSTTTSVIKQTISGGLLDLFSGTPTGTHALVDSTGIMKFGSAYIASLADTELAAGSYFLELTGTASAKVSPTISVSTATSAIPEPSTWAMMAIGVAALGFAGVRRRSKDRLAPGL